MGVVRVNVIWYFCYYEDNYLHDGQFLLQAGEQGRLPLLILSMKESDKENRPAVVFLHSTHKCKEWLRPLLEVGSFLSLL